MSQSTDDSRWPWATLLLSPITSMSITLAAVGGTRRGDRLQHPHGGAVALAEDDVRAGGDHRLGDAASAGRVSECGWADHRIADRDVGSRRARAACERCGLRIPRRRLARHDDAKRAGSCHARGQDAGEVRAVVTGQRVVHHKPRAHHLAGRVDDRNRHVALDADLERSGIVTAGMRNNEIGAVAGELAHDRADVAVADAFGDLDLRRHGAWRLRARSRCPCWFQPMSVPRSGVMMASLRTRRGGCCENAGTADDKKVAPASRKKSAALETNSHVWPPLSLARCQIATTMDDRIVTRSA